MRFVSLGPVAGSEGAAPVRFNSPPMASPLSSYPSSERGANQSSATPICPSTAQSLPSSHVPSSASQPMLHHPVLPPMVPQQVLPPPAGSQASGYRGSPPISFNNSSMPFRPSYPSSAVGAYQHFPTPVGAEASGYRAALPIRFNSSPTSCPLSFHPSSDVSAHQRFPTLNNPSARPLPPVPPSDRKPVLCPPVSPSIGQQHVLPPTAYVHPQTHIPLMTSKPPPQTANLTAPRDDILPSPLGSPFPAAQSVLDPSLHGYPSRQVNPVTHAPASCTPFLAQKGGFVPPTSVGTPIGPNSGQQMQYSSMGPPVGAIQGLVEEFSSLCVGLFPGSVDPGIDIKALPRPLDGDVESSSFVETYPLNCHPRYLRLTTRAIPNSQTLFSRWHLPLGVVIHPLAEAPDGEKLPIVNFGPTGIIRCRRCKAHVNPYVTFFYHGRKWCCNLCEFLNDVPDDYLSRSDSSGGRCDAEQQLVSLKGSVEFVAPTEYMSRPPMPPRYFFLIDVSLSAVRSGMIEIVAKTIKSCLDELPGFPRTQIGFLTFDSTLHFYNMKSSLTLPQMMVVADLDDLFVPLPDDLVVNLSESRNVVDAFLDSLPFMFQDNANIESAFGPALKAACRVMSQLGGKLLIFQTTLPSLGIGCLKLRGNDPCIYGTDKEHTLRIAEDPFYKQMAAELSNNQIGVNVYAFSDQYSDIASLGTLAKYTCGQVNYYPSFQGGIHTEKFRCELTRDLTRETAWEAVMRVRCGKGLRLTTFHGHLMFSSSDLMDLPALDCDKAFGLELSLEDTLLTTQNTFIQVSLLYTSSSGERRIRVHTAAVPVVTDLGEMYRHADIGAIVSVLSRLAIEKTLSHTLEEARQTVKLIIVKALREYRNLYATQHQLGVRMIYSESLKLLPLYGLALCKSVPLHGGYADVQLDECCAAGFNMMILPVKQLMKLLYPSLTRIDHHLVKAPADADDFRNLSKQLPLAAESLDPTGLYMYDNGFCFIIWFGGMLSSEIVKNLIGGDLTCFPDLSKVNLTEFDNEVSRKLMGIIRASRENCPSDYHVCHLVRQGEQPRENTLLVANLIEDQTRGICSYVDWIQQLHRQVLQIA
ncbi:protein transport protein SEC24 A-like [Magnolia sinica]|uniref:protein transport protein SEC24 A-like n=1 Tax=Magnolia sinica TaxID=86752 RepID=UPI0026594EE6|nr:protein transport protein SEC24 A-like [Magnolia sinica]